MINEGYRGQVPSYILINDQDEVAYQIRMILHA